MWDVYALAAMAALILLLMLLTYRRQRELRGSIHLGEEVVNELLAAVVKNAKTGRITAIADRVTEILKNNLKCDRIVFLVNNSGTLELRHYSGIENPDYASYRFALGKEKIKILRTFTQVTPIKELEKTIEDRKYHELSDLGFKYFFAVNIGSRFSGIYLLRSSLSHENPSLKLLTSALAYSLSSADHIRQQDKRIRRLESTISSANMYEKIEIEKKRGVRPELTRLLRIKNSRKLVGELIKQISKEGNLPRVALYTGEKVGGEGVFSVNWSLNGETDQTLRDFYENHEEVLRKNDILDIGKLSVSTNGKLKEQLQKLADNRVRYVASVPWINNRRALLAWDCDVPGESFDGSLLEFWNNALPMVENLNRFEKAEEMSYTDGLTGLYNFRYFQKRMIEEFQRAERYGHSMSLLIFDVDNLKTVNDNMGHPAGDILLKSFAEVLMESVRSIDVICRYGGDEFCMILPETSRNRALLLMDRIMKNISAGPVSVPGQSEKLRYSVSIGGAVYPADAQNVQDLIKAADSALLEAKESGRHCSRLFSGEELRNSLKRE